MTASASDMYDDENTDFHYHEISEIQIPITDIVTRSNTFIREAYDENEPTFVNSELSRQMISRTGMSLTSSGTGDTLNDTHEPITFLTLADVIAIESETDRTDVKSVRYESLDPTGQADKSQYTTLV
ncbi:hypothetical protein DPMN_049090 [Dreissena polymorpha]|uniref:Uncharacterized protein n=1 Tax=Dreissena polymorpha TaxID=45954 RepID=A0A9D4DCU4_DREPO|nr:hypothetical protein DPMN_049090 [Dreissena polymorpha]